METRNSTNRAYQLMAIELMKEIDEILTDNGIWYSLSYGSALGAVREKGFIEWDRDVDIMIKRPDQDKVRTLLKNNLSKKYIVDSCKEDNVSSYDVVEIEGVYSGGMHVDIYPLVAGPLNEDKGYKFQLHCRRVHKILGCKYLDISRVIYKWKIPFVYIIRGIEYLIPNRVLRAYIDKLATRYEFSEATYFFPFSNDGKKGEYMRGDLLFETKRLPFESLMLPVPARSEEYLIRLYGKDYMTPCKY